MTQPKFDIQVKPKDGNAFAILGSVQKALRTLERDGIAPEGTTEKYLEEAQAGDYDHLLRTSIRYVDLQPSE